MAPRNPLLDIDAFVDERECAALSTLSKSQRRREIARGRFPSPIAITARRKAWLRSELLAWLRQKVEEARS